MGSCCLALAVSARCEIGLVVHPVNTPPVIHVDDRRLLAATNGGIVKPHKHVHLHGVLRLSDPDEEASAVLNCHFEHPS